MSFGAKKNMTNKESLELSFNFAGDYVRVLVLDKATGTIRGYGEILLTPNKEEEKTGL